LRRRGRPLCHDAESGKIVRLEVARLNQQATVYTAELQRPGALGRRGQRAGLQQPNALLPARARCQQVKRSIGKSWGDDAFDQPLWRGDVLGSCFVHLWMDPENAAVSAQRISLVRLAEGLGQGGSDGRAAGIIVFDYHRRRFGKLANQVQSTVEVQDI